MLAFVSGMVTGGGLIIAVGAQNSFLLEQSLKKHYAFQIALLFTLSDAIAITLGAFGFGLLLQHNPWLLVLSKWGGILFLIWFASQKWRSSFNEEHLILEQSRQRLSLLPLFLTSLAVTWLNPHFYLDTLILMGNLANQWQQHTREFVYGGIFASTVWFFTLSFIGKLCSQWLESASFWRYFNRTNAVLITGIALKIAFEPLP